MTSNDTMTEIEDFDAKTAETFEKPNVSSEERLSIQFSPGAKLLCINDSGIRRKYTPGPPVNGQIYCVRELYEAGGIPGVLLVGIVGPDEYHGLECGFLLSRFRWVHA